jgi:C4-dicarboxylate-specific signal transduction histidine kinase
MDERVQSHPGRVAWTMAENPELMDALSAAGFQLQTEGASVVISSDPEARLDQSYFGARHIVIIDTDASAEPALEAGAFRVMRHPVEPEALVVQVQRATTSWRRARRMVMLDDIVERTHDIVLVTDRAGVISSINEAGSAVLGLERTGSRVQALLPGAVEATEGEQVEYQVDSGQGVRWIQGAWQVVEHPQAGFIGRLLVARDVTRERSLRRDLVRSGALAELGLLSAEVAHEVNNPATYLMTNLSMLRDDLQAGGLDPVEAAELIEECLDGVNRITDIVKRMRGLASGHADDTRRMTDLSWVARDACRIAGLRVKYKADLHIHDAQMPEVMASGKRIGQVVLNLVVNAADAVGGQLDPMPRIDVSIGQDDEWAWIDVADNGPGVPEKMRERMFEAFVTSKSEAGGTGLGLAVSEIIAEEHGGRLELRSHEGRGAWFRLWLPLPAQ